MNTADLKPHLRKLIREAIDDEATLEKNRQFIRLDKADKYFRGLQYVAPTLVDGAIRYDSVGAPITPNDGEDAEGADDYNIDLIATYGRRWTAVLGQRPYYALKAVPDDPQSEEDRKAARQAEIAKLWLHNKWDAEVKNLAIAHKQYKAGTVWLYTPYTVDSTFGETEEPVIEEREVTWNEGGYDCISCGARFTEPDTDEFGFQWCPSCGAEAPMAPTPPQTVPVPEIVDYKTYPNGGAAFHVCDGLTVTVSFYSKDVRRIPYLVYEYEEHKGTLLQLHPTLRKFMNEKGELSKEESESDTNSEGVHTRAGTESLDGSHKDNPNRWTYTRYWLSTDLYELIADDKARDELKNKFPSGMKLPCVEGILLLDDAEDEAAHEVWTPVLPGMSDYLYADPVCWPIIGHQDLHNDMWNIMVATLERGLPTTIVDAGLLDVDRINEQSYLPQEIVETKGQVGSSLDSRIKTIPSARFPEQAPSLLGKIEESVQNVTSLTPRTYGGASGGPKMTAEQARTDLQQGMTQIGTPGVLLGRGWVNATTNAVKQLEKYAPQEITVSITGDGGPVSELLDFEALRGGNWHFEGKQGVPQSFAERREAVNAIIKENPELAQAMAMLDPINYSAMQDYIGVHDLKHPPAAMREKTLEVIQQLLEQAPTRQVMPDGSVQVLPSIPPEEFVDDHPMIAKLVRDWCTDGPGRKAKQDKPDGYENVKAYGMAQERAFRMAQMEQQTQQRQVPPSNAPQVTPGEPPPVNQPEQGI